MTVSSLRAQKRLPGYARLSVTRHGQGLVASTLQIPCSDRGLTEELLPIIRRVDRSLDARRPAKRISMFEKPLRLLAKHLSDAAVACGQRAEHDRGVLKVRSFARDPAIGSCRDGDVALKIHFERQAGIEAVTELPVADRLHASGPAIVQPRRDTSLEGRAGHSRGVLSGLLRRGRVSDKRAHDDDRGGSDCAGQPSHGGPPPPPQCTPGRGERQRYTIIGVLPAGFRFTYPLETEVWRLLPWTRVVPSRALEFQMIARLKPDAIPGQAQAELTTVAQDISRAWGLPDDFVRDQRARLRART
jgi:hypothetical protein